MPENYEKCYNKFKDELEDYIQTKESKVYHYTSSSGLKNILSSKKIWFSNIEYLNDEDEMYYTYKLAINVANELKDKLNEDFYNIIINSHERYLKQKESQKQFFDYYVASFSKEKDSLSLWNYYTKSSNSAGYNICFNNIKDIINHQLEDLKDKLDTSRILFGKVVYNKEKQKNILKKYMINFNKIYLKETKKENSTLLELFYWYTIRDCSIFFKHPAFEQEKEFRIILPRGIYAENNDFIKIRESGKLFIPYLEIEFKPQNVLSITCSPTTKNQLIQAGVKKMLLSYGYNNIPVEGSDIPLRY